jgi:hypothetical protein
MRYCEKWRFGNERTGSLVTPEDCTKMANEGFCLIEKWSKRRVKALDRDGGLGDQNGACVPDGPQTGRSNWF